MNVTGYLNALKERLLSDPQVVRFQIRRERTGVMNGYWRGIVLFADHSQKEISESVNDALRLVIQLGQIHRIKSASHR